MQKIIIKTTIITIISCVILGVIAYFSLAFLSPLTISELYFDLSVKELSVDYAEKAYQKDNTIENLANVVDKAIWAEDKETLDKYLPNLIGNDKFSSFCQSQTQNGYLTSVEYYYVSQMVILHAEMSRLDMAFELAFQKTTNYTAVNPIKSLITFVIESKNNQTLTDLINFYKDYDISSMQNSEQIIIDFEMLEQLNKLQ